MPAKRTLNEVTGYLDGAEKGTLSGVIAPRPALVATPYAPPYPADTKEDPGN